MINISLVHINVKLIDPHLQAIESCVSAAGFSVGEFAALVFSGAMNFAEGKAY